MRQDKKEIKECETRIPLILDPREKIQKKKFQKNTKKIQKLKKQLSGVISSQNGMRQDDIGRERDKRILDPNSAHTRPGGANYKKKIAKKFEKLENNYSALFLGKS